MQILFITSNRIGDAVLSTGLLSHLIDAHPDARFTIACGPIAAPLLRAVPRLDRLIPLTKRPLAQHWLSLWLSCIGTHWDLIVDLRNSVVSRLVPRRRLAIHRRLPSLHKVEEIAAVLSLSPPPAPRLWIDAEARAEADLLLPPKVPFLAVGPTANWPGKEWPTDRFAELIRRLTGPTGLLPSAPVAVFSAGSEITRAQPLIAALGDQAIDLTGSTTLLGAAACVQRAALYIGNDSGLMHIAAAVGTPTIGLFGPGFPNVYGPWGKRGCTVVSAEPQDALFTRWRAGEGKLMDGITIDAVEAAARSLFAEPVIARGAIG